MSEEAEAAEVFKVLRVECPADAVAFVTAMLEEVGATVDLVGAKVEEEPNGKRGGWRMRKPYDKGSDTAKVVSITDPVWAECYAIKMRFDSLPSAAVRAMIKPVFRWYRKSCEWVANASHVSVAVLKLLVEKGLVDAAMIPVVNEHIKRFP